MINITESESFKLAKSCHSATVQAFMAAPEGVKHTALKVVVECGILLAACECGVPVVGPGVWSVIAAASVRSAAISEDSPVPGIGAD